MKFEVQEIMLHGTDTVTSTCSRITEIILVIKRAHFSPRLAQDEQKFAHSA